MGLPALTLRSFLCSRVFSHTRTHRHGLALSHLRAQASLSVKWAQLFALGRGLARASKTQLWNASGKGMGLHTGPASMAANASWEVAQDEALESGQGPPEFPGGRNELGRGLLMLARWSCPLEPRSTFESAMMTGKRETVTWKSTPGWGGGAGWSAATQTKLPLEEEGRQRCSAARSQESATSLFSRVFKMQPQL